MSKTVLLLMVGVSTVLSACSSSSIRLPDAIQGLESDVREMGYLSFSDLLSSRPESIQAIDQYVMKKQCFYRRSNPIILFALQDVTLTLKGTFTTEGKFEVSASGPVPTAGLSFGATKGAEQTVQFPVSAVSLGVLPTIFMETEAKGIAGVPDSQKEPLFKAILANRDIIKQRVEGLINSYDPRKCPKES